MNGEKWRWTSVGLGLILLLTSAIGVTGGVPRTLHYQGRITDPVTGDPLPGSHTVTFCIYDDLVAGTELWCETQELEADGDGVIAALLGSTEALALPFDTAYWLEVEVDGQILTPRREIASVAYALFAADSDSLDGLDASSYALTAHTHDVDTVVPDIVSSISDVSNDGGNIELVAGENVTIDADDVSDTITIAAIGGGGLSVIASHLGWRDMTGYPSYQTLKSLDVPAGVVTDYIIVLARWNAELYYEDDGVEARIRGTGGVLNDDLQPPGSFFMYQDDTETGNYSDVVGTITTTTIYTPTETEKAEGFTVSLQARFSNGEYYNYIHAGPTWILGR